MSFRACLIDPTFFSPGPVGTMGVSGVDFEAPVGFGIGGGEALEYRWRRATGRRRAEKYGQPVKESCQPSRSI